MKTIVLPLAFVITSIIFCALYFADLWVIDIRALAGFSTTHCVFYDRPPRTGSTTIADALETCLISKGYELTKAVNRSMRSEVVSRMVESEEMRIGAVKGHLKMVLEDVTALRRKCDRLLYITSVRPMRERLASSVKYGLFKGHGNKTIKSDAFETALDGAISLEKQEVYLEHYPYIRDPVPSLKQRLRPSYIIRPEELMHDTVRLLRSLSCSNTPSVDNVHPVKAKSGQDPSSKIELRLGDALYRHLYAAAAKQNERGLKLATNF